MLNWNGADGGWDDAGAWSGTTFINNAPVSFIADTNGTTLTVTDGTPLRVGQIITGPNSGARMIDLDLGGGQYRVVNNLVAGTGGALVANTEVSVRFNTVGDTTLSGVKYLNQITTGNFTGTRTISGAAGSLINFAAKDGGDAVNLSGAGSLVFDGVNLSNGALTVNNNLNLNNNGSGLLVFKNATLNSRDGVKFYNAVGSETVFENVNFEATQGGRYLQFQRGVFTFKGSNATTGSYTPGYTRFGGYGTVVVNFAANSNFTVSGGDMQFAIGNELVTVNVSGTLTANTKVQLGNSSGTAVMNVDSGGFVKSTGDLNIANSTGLGVLNINSGGTVAPVGVAYVAPNTGTGRLNVNAGGLYTTANATSIGFGAGAGEVNVSAGGTFNSTGNVTVGYGAGLGRLTMQGSGSLNNTLTVGYGSGTGIVNVSGNGYLWLNNGLNMATNAAAHTELNITNSGTVIARAAVNIGTAGSAVVNVSGSGSLDTQNAQNIYVGTNAGASGTLNINGGSVIGGDIVAGTNGGKGVVNVTSGSAVLGGNRYLTINQGNSKDGSSGILNISGGVVQTNGVLFGSTSATAGTGTAHLNLTGGTLILVNNSGFHTGAYNSPVTENDPTHTASDTQINLGGGTIVARAGFTSAMAMNLTGSNGNVKFEMRGANGTTKNTVTLSGGLTGAGGLDVTYGTLVVQGANSYRGQTKVSADGVFTLDNNATLAVSLADLGGLAAFDGAGTLTLNGKVTLSDDLTQLNGDYQLIGAGLLGAKLTLNSAWLTDFTQSVGNTNQWLYNANNEIFFDKSTGILTLAQIPEPSALALMLTGGALLALLRRRR